jgi:alkanesulfonate monooxygenase SsuD/methylene tetrahydromethanopterin reductase-like flavin-dependent oxidoreductase (luciferase family)
MKFHWFHLMPYPELPDDFKEKHHSVWVDVPSKLFDPAVGHATYNEYLDELEYADEVGFDGICVNEHHQNAYGMMPSPNLIAAALARRTKNAALVVLGNSIALYNPPTRIAEEFAMLDVVSGGRLVAGFPIGSAMDTTVAYGQIPATLREKYYEGHDLILKAWTEPEPFAFNGKHTQLRYVNVWPRPVQKPHPPVWAPGGGSIETWEWTTEKDHLYAYLSYAGHKRGKSVMDGFWKRVREMGGHDNPYRAGYLQLVVVADSDAQAQEDFAEAADYFYNRCLHVYRGFADVPGYQTLRSIESGIGAGGFGLQQPHSDPGEVWKDCLAEARIIAGTPEKVTEQLRQVATDLRVGHLMVLLHFGNAKKDAVMRSTRLFAERVAPNLRDLWSDYEDRWWIKPLPADQRVAPQTPRQLTTA